MEQSKNVKEFLEHYNQVNSLGAESFEIDFQREILKSINKNDPELVELNKAYDLNQQNIVFAERACASVNLTKTEAVEIVNMRDREGSIVYLDGINGADAYNYMNDSIKNSPTVATAALKAQEETSYQHMKVKVDIPPILENQVAQRMNDEPNLSKDEALGKLADREKKMDEYLKGFSQTSTSKNKQTAMSM